MDIIITPEAEKQYRALPTIEQRKIKKKLLLLQGNPLAGKKLSGSLSELHSLKAWPYRILYYLPPSRKKIYIVTIAHRQGVYSNA